MAHVYPLLYCIESVGLHVAETVYCILDCHNSVAPHHTIDLPRACLTSSMSILATTYSFALFAMHLLRFKKSLGPQKPGNPFDFRIRTNCWCSSSLARTSYRYPCMVAPYRVCTHSIHLRCLVFTETLPLMLFRSFPSKYQQQTAYYRSTTCAFGSPNPISFR